MCRLDRQFRERFLNKKKSSDVPLRLVFIRAATAPNLERAYIVKTISGEFVVKTATKSPVLIPWA